MKVPFNQSYWVIPEKLLAGCYPGSEDRQQARKQLKGLIDHGIRQVINLMRGDELNWIGRAFVPYEKIMQSIADSKGLSISIERMPIEDRWIPSRIEMGRILDKIDGCIAVNRPVYVHCLGGPWTHRHGGGMLSGQTRYRLPSGIAQNDTEFKKAHGNA